MKKVRTRRALETRIDTEWELDDFLVALKARMGPIKRIGCDVMNSAIRLCRILWPKEPTPTTARTLAEKMMDAEDRLTEWRQSAARVDADEACVIFVETLVNPFSSCEIQSVGNWDRNLGTRFQIRGEGL